MQILEWIEKHKGLISLFLSFIQAIGMIFVAAAFFVSVFALQQSEKALKQSEIVATARITFDLERLGLEVANQTLGNPILRAYLNTGNATLKEDDYETIARMAFSKILHLYDMAYKQYKLDVVSPQDWELWKAKFCAITKTKGGRKYIMNSKTLRYFYSQGFRNVIQNCYVHSISASDTTHPSDTRTRPAQAVSRSSYSQNSTSNSPMASASGDKLIIVNASP